MGVEVRRVRVAEWRALYARVGFQPAGARQPLPSNPAVDELLLRLPLDPLR